MTTGSDELTDFPCELPIKVFGRNSAVFRESVLAIVRTHYRSIGADRIREQISRRGNYLSITVTVHAVSREQIDRVYRELTASDDVLMVL